jgi:hypothetical protein
MRPEKREQDVWWNKRWIVDIVWRPWQMRNEIFKRRTAIQSKNRTRTWWGIWFNFFNLTVKIGAQLPPHLERKRNKAIREAERKRIADKKLKPKKKKVAKKKVAKKRREPLVSLPSSADIDNDPKEVRRATISFEDVTLWPPTARDEERILGKAGFDLDGPVTRTIMRDHDIAFYEQEI